MILKHYRSIANLPLLGPTRKYSYKPIKRPDFTSSARQEFVDKKLKDFKLHQVLRAKIEMSGPVTGNFVMSNIDIAKT